MSTVPTTTFDPENPFVQKYTDQNRGGTNPTPTPEANNAPKPGASSGVGPLKTGYVADNPPAADVVPTDPKQFQAYLNGKGAKPPLVVDGIIGPKTLAAAQTLGVAVPPELNPAATPASAVQAAAGSAATATGAAPAGQSALTAGSGTPAELTPAQITDAMKTQYGNLGALLDNPDVAAALQTAIKEGLDPAGPEVQALLMATPTYQNHQQKELNFLALKPVDQQGLIDAQTATIGKQAQSLGVALAPDRLTDIATNAAKFGWDAAQVTNAIAAEFHYKPGGQTGAIGAEELSTKALAQDYNVGNLLDDNTLASYDAQIANGTANPADIKARIVALAQQRFPGLAAQITDTNPTRSALSPYKGIAQSELGLNPDSIDWTQPMWMKLVDQVDPKTGVHVPMSLSDAAQTLRSDPSYGWDRTPNGVAAGYATATALAKSLGVMA